MTASILFSSLPCLLLVAGLLMLLPAPLLAVHRTQASIASLWLLLSALLMALVWLPTDTSPLTFALLPFGAALIAAPLLERARFLGLSLTALAGSAALSIAMPAMLPHLPTIAPLALLLVGVVTALLTGMIGGARLPLHPQRHRADGNAIWHAAPQGVMFAGWVALTAGIVLLVGIETLTRTHAIAMLVAAMLALFIAQRGHGQDALQKAGEGLAAGLLASLLVPLSPLGAGVVGLLAGFLVSRSEAIALGLRLDDPHHFLGALLLPSMLGLLLPGFVELALLAEHLKWLGGTLVLAAALSLLVWPLGMFLLGIALPSRLVREGVHPR